jgi:hypothetical protein
MTKPAKDLSERVGFEISKPVSNSAFIDNPIYWDESPDFQPWVSFNHVKLSEKKLRIPLSKILDSQPELIEQRKKKYCGCSTRSDIIGTWINQQYHKKFSEYIEPADYQCIIRKIYDPKNSEKNWDAVTGITCTCFGEHRILQYNNEKEISRMQEIIDKSACNELENIFKNIRFNKKKEKISDYVLAKIREYAQLDSRDINYYGAREIIEAVIDSKRKEFDCLYKDNRVISREKYQTFLDLILKDLCQPLMFDGKVNKELEQDVGIDYIRNHAYQG